MRDIILNKTTRLANLCYVVKFLVINIFQIQLTKVKLFLCSFLDY